MDNRLLTLLQLCDSNFPTGAFSHSFGLETYIQEESISDKTTFAVWLRAYLHKQLVYADGLACRLAHEALEHDQLDKVWSCDREITVLNLSRESREGSRRMGERMIRIGLELWKIPLLEEYQKRVREKKSFGHPAIVYPILASQLGISKEETILSFLYSCLSTLIQNGVRGIPLGQTDGQRLLLEIQPDLLQAVERIAKLDADDLGAVSPGLELAQMRHERLHVRLFMS